MNNVIKMEHFMGVKEDAGDILGKFLYFSLSNVLIDRGKLSDICEEMNLPVKVGKRMGSMDAFKSATGDISDRIVKTEYGERRIYKIYCRDNHTTDETASRELVEEALHDSTNRYRKLANIFFNKKTEQFDYTVSGYTSEVDAYKYCQKAEELFKLYQTCVGRNHLENLTDSYLDQMESLKITIHGRLFFIPKKHMHELDVFEDFIEAVNANNLRNTQLTVNSMYVIDDEKQRGKMTVEFYHAMQKEIELYTEKVETLIKSGSNSPAIMERWAQKIGSLEEKKKHYEGILRQDLSELGEQYETLKFLADELTLRARKIRTVKKCA